MTFVQPWALVGLTVLPVLVVAYVLVHVRRNRRRPAGLELTATAAEAAALAMPDSGPSPRRRHLPPAIFLVAIAALLFSLARPEMNLTLPIRTGTVVLAFDTSNSMIADDVEPTRLDRAKEMARRFVDRRPGSVQIGVVAFTNGGLVVQQPTKTQADVLAAIDRLTTDGGTSIAEGIFAALTAISGDPIEVDPAVAAGDIAAIDIGYFSNSAVLLFTDGEDVGGADPVELATLASNAGVAVHTVGVGTPRGTVVALDGFSIATALDESTLEQIAETTGGGYYTAREEADLSSIFDTIGQSFERRGERIEITALLAMFALVCVITGALINLRWLGRVV